MNKKNPTVAKTVLTKRSNIGGFLLPDFKSYYNLLIQCGITVRVDTH